MADKPRAKSQEPGAGDDAASLNSQPSTLNYDAPWPASRIITTEQLARLTPEQRQKFQQIGGTVTETPAD